MASGDHGVSPEALNLPFAIDSGTGAPLPNEVEALLGWLSVVRKVPLARTSRADRPPIDALAKVYLPLWVVSLGGRLALVDPTVDRGSKIEYREPDRIDGFVERLQATHRKVSMFRNILEAYQNAFPITNTTNAVEVQGLIAGSEVGTILQHARKMTNGGLRDFSNPPTLGDGSYMAVKGAVSSIQRVYKTFSEGIEELKLARSVLKVETESQLKSLNEEVATLRTEYNSEIEATKDLADRTIQALLTKRDDEITIIASRFTEIREMLVSDLMNMKKAQSAILREEGYLRKIAAASVASRLTPGSDMVKLLLGDHASRLRTMKDESSKIQVLVDEIEKEKGRELSAIKDLYDELIMAKSRVISDLQIELEVEVEKRTAEVEELTELQKSLDKRFEGVTIANEDLLKKLDWMVPDDFGLRASAPLYVTVYAGLAEGEDRPLLACSPGVFSSGLPPMGASYTLEERLKPVSSYLKTLVEVHLVNRMQREQDFRRKTVQLVKSKDMLPLLPNLLPVGLKTALDRGWTTESRARDIGAFAAKYAPTAGGVAFAGRGRSPG
ncbi:MAG: hypothetical protein JRM80_06690 [Nitrososphaerota archaeon]|nr:hypothetical protein [Nitrososphaerota archaeon]